jgi:hypothetical protein
MLSASRTFGHRPVYAWIAEALTGAVPHQPEQM